MNCQNRPENEVGSPLTESTSRRNERGTRSEAECQKDLLGHDVCISKQRSVSRSGNVKQVVGATTGGATPPSFLVPIKDNVHVSYLAVTSLLTMWDFLIYKERASKINVLFNKKNDPSVLKVMSNKDRCRYFEEGRSYISWKIKKRLGKYERVPGLMETLTYDPNKIKKMEAWACYGHDTRRFLNSINEYRRRRGWRRLHYLWVVEVQKETGYPHVHIFFPKLKWLAPIEVLSSNWCEGRANIESPKKIKVNCAAYISKYLRKANSWTDLHLAMLWSGGSRMYGFSRGFSIKEKKKESDWQVWHIVENKNHEQLEKSLEEGGFKIERVLRGTK